jgi:VanZ family protein
MREWRRWWPVLGWAAWALLLACWTAALLSRDAPRVGAAWVPEQYRFWVAKGLHLSSYALLAFLACWLPGARGARGAVWALLLAHAALTEVGQRFVEGRTGTFRDVLINAAGIALGITAGLSLRRLFRPPAP